MGLRKGAIRFEQKFMEGVELMLQSEAAKVHEYMDEKAPWTDRTGQARKELTATVQTTTLGWRIVLAQGVEYGVYLEFAHEKKYAIIQPTIQALSPDIMKRFQGMIDKLEVPQEPDAPPQGGG